MGARQQLRLDWLNGNVRDLRVRYERACRVIPAGAHEWRTIDAGDRRIRILMHKAESRADQAIFYFHGGGWIVGSPATHADITSALSTVTGLPVISIDYRLAPEHKAPAAIDDGLAVLEHFLGSCFKSAILCGDSAGGAVALAVERHAAHLKGKIVGVSSLYGSFGLTANPSLHVNGKTCHGLDARTVRRYWMSANMTASRSPYAIPALAHAAGCPVHLLIAGRDPLRNDSIALARALREKGRPITVDLHPFEGHSFLQAPHARRSKIAAYRKIVAWISALSQGP